MERARYSVRDEVTDTVEAFYRAVSNKNMKAIDVVWAHEPYASVAGRSGHLRQGWPQVRAYWDQRFHQLGTVKVHARLRGSVCRAVGDVAWISGTEIRRVTDGDAERKEELRMTVILERRNNDWQIVSYHASEPAAALTPLASIA